MRTFKIQYSGMYGDSKVEWLDCDLKEAMRRELRESFAENYEGKELEEAVEEDLVAMECWIVEVGVCKVFSNWDDEVFISGPSKEEVGLVVLDMLVNKEIALA